MITLPKPGDEGYDKAQQIIRRKPRGRSMAIAYHAPIAHVLNKPCIYFNPKPRWSRYPLVHQRNVVAVLKHEALHCAVMRVLGFNEMTEVVQHQIIDVEFAEVGDL